MPAASFIFTLSPEWEREGGCSRFFETGPVILYTVYTPGRENQFFVQFFTTDALVVVVFRAELVSGSFLEGSNYEITKLKVKSDQYQTLRTRLPFKFLTSKSYCQIVESQMLILWLILANLM